MHLCVNAKRKILQILHLHHWIIRPNGILKTF